jgi:hypothetical protein
MTPAERMRRHRERRRQAAPVQMASYQVRDLFTITNLFPRRTGLPMTVWVSPRGRARHAARIKVNLRHGERMTIGNTAVVRLEPLPEVVVGDLTAADREAVFRWIELNKAALLEHWDGLIDGGDLIERLQPLPAAEPRR